MRRIFPYALLALGIFSFFYSWFYLRRQTYGVRTERIAVSSVKQIIPLTDTNVIPRLYTHVSGLSELPSGEAKRTFIAAVLPAILVAKHDIEMTIVRLKILEEEDYWSVADSMFYVETKRRFKARDLQDLMLKVGTLPNSIVLAQAAVESGWGQSRLFLQGNNLFGVWSFNKDEPRIAAGRARQDKTIYLKAYPDISQSIVNYFEILSSSSAYRGLREVRRQETDPFKLLPYLRNFSERRSQYTRQLKVMIEQNDLTAYDAYRLDPTYLYRD